MNAAAKKTLQSLRGKNVLVTGGGGYVGNRIVLEMLRNGVNKVKVLDLRFPSEASIPNELKEVYKSRVEQLRVDLRDHFEVSKSLKDVDLVIHTASFGMSGKEMMMKSKVRAVNIGGTQTLLDACIENSIIGFVYTSSANVVFTGRRELPDLDEDLPYNLEQDCVDEYSKTKCIAEQLVIKANGTKLKNKNTNTQYETLATCAVRPAAIYGEGEERHFPRIISMMEKHMLVFNIGKPTDLVDWVHVDNLVYGHVLAAAKLASQNPADRKLVGGKSYYISDKKPINNFIFMKPLIEGLGYQFPKIWIPFSVMFYLAWFLEIIHTILKPVYFFTPLLSRAEVCKVGVTHYFRTDKAERELDWSLVITPEAGVNKMVAYFQKDQLERAKNKPKPKEGNGFFLIAILLILGLLILVQYLKW